MSEYFFIASMIIITGICIHLLARKKETLPATTCIALVLAGKADLFSVYIAATVIGSSVRWQADRLNRPLLFLRVCGDFYDDFFPPNLPSAELSPRVRANMLMASCIRFYKQTGAKKTSSSSKDDLTAFCEGAGFCLSSFRRLAEIIPEMASLISALDPKPHYMDREPYAEYYREIGRLAAIPQDRIEISLSIRLSCFANERVESDG